MAQAVIRRPFITGAPVRSRVSSCEIYGRQSGTGADFSSGSLRIHISLSVHECFILISMYPLLLPKGKKQTKPGTLKQNHFSFGSRGPLDRKYFLLVFKSLPKLRLLVACPHTTGTEVRSRATWCVQVVRYPNFFLGNGSR